MNLQKKSKKIKTSLAELASVDINDIISISNQKQPKEQPKEQPTESSPIISVNKTWKDIVTNTIPITEQTVDLPMLKDIKIQAPLIKQSIALDRSFNATPSMNGNTSIGRSGPTKQVITQKSVQVYTKSELESVNPDKKYIDLLNATILQVKQSFEDIQSFIKSDDMREINKMIKLSKNVVIAFINGISQNANNILRTCHELDSESCKNYKFAKSTILREMNIKLDELLAVKLSSIMRVLQQFDIQTWIKIYNNIKSRFINADDEDSFLHIIYMNIGDSNLVEQICGHRFQPTSFGTSSVPKINSFLASGRSVIIANEIVYDMKQHGKTNQDVFQLNGYFNFLTSSHKEELYKMQEIHAQHAP